MAAGGVQRSPARPRAQRQAGSASAPSGNFKLMYFDAHGRIETSRMLMVLAGQDYEDFRYPISFGTPGDMSTIKRDEFDADQKAGKFDFGMNMIPVIESGDFRLPQSKAIERYLAKKLGFMGATLEEEAWVDAVNEHAGDIGAAYGKKESEQKWFQEVLPAYLQKLETTLPGSDGFAVGAKTSLADVAIYRLLKDVQPPYDASFDKDVAAAYSACPKVKAIVERLDAHDGLQKWIAERPKSTVG